MGYTIYHNSRCSKSRSALEILQSKGIEPKIINYLETPPRPSELKEILALLGKSAHEIARSGEDRYSELKLDTDPPKSEDKWIEILCKNPILIERPIIVVESSGKKGAVVGRPPERVLELISVL